MAVPLAGTGSSQGPPEEVVTATRKASEPLPRLKTVIRSLLASAPSTNEKLRLSGSTLRRGTPPASTVRVTGTLRVEGFALGTVTVTLPW